MYSQEDNSTIYARWEKIPEANPEILPGKVTKVEAAGSKTNSITIKWAKQTGVSGYIIYRLDPGEKKWIQLKRTSGQKYTDKKKKYGTAYQYRVTAYIQKGSSIQEGEPSNTLLTATRPNKPSLKVKKINKKVKLIWSKNTRADRISIMWKIGKGKYKELTDKPAKSKSLLKSLKKGKIYRFKIRGYKKAGNRKIYSAYSKERKVQFKK